MRIENCSLTEEDRERGILCRSMFCELCKKRREMDREGLSGFKKYKKKPIPILAKKINEDFEVETLEGTMRAKSGDYLIVGVRGEKYPCDAEIFEETYEEVNNEESM